MLLFSFCFPRSLVLKVLPIQKDVVLESDFLQQLGYLLPKKMVFIGSENLKLFLTTISAGVTHRGEHLLLFLRLPGCAQVIFSQL